MQETLEALVTAYDEGALTRRGFVTALAAVLTARRGSAEAPLRANSLNHVSLAVSEPETSRAFYESLLGVEVVSRQPNGINLGLGDSFLGLYEIPGPPRIHHFCVGVDGFEIDAAARELRGAGVSPRIRQDRPEIYFEDPDGIVVQLEDRAYRG